MAVLLIVKANQLKGGKRVKTVICSTSAQGHDVIRLCVWLLMLAIMAELIMAELSIWARVDLPWKAPIKVSAVSALIGICVSRAEWQ